MNAQSKLITVILRLLAQTPSEVTLANVTQGTLETVSPAPISMNARLTGIIVIKMLLVPTLPVVSHVPVTRDTQETV